MMMDWNLRSSTNWDFTHFEPEKLKSVNTGGGSSGGGDFSVDLKLGQVVNGGPEYGRKWSESGGGKSSKRAERGCGGALTASSLVDGCRSDLNICRDYHRRHKVCELHSKTPQVSIGGQKQRFCQQCSRFHCLQAFDEGKRSCRKRLDGHNRRRRKPQPESALGPAKVFSNYQASIFLRHDPSYMAIHDWPELDCLLHNEQLHFLEKHNLCRGSPSYPNWKMLQFQAPPGQPLLQNRAFLESGEDRTKTLNDRFSTAVCESDCALSLLSSPQSQSVISLPHHHTICMESVLVPGGPALLGPVGDLPPPTLPCHWS